MLVNEDQYILANNLLVALKKLAGQPFTHDDVLRLAEAIAKRTWLEEQLNQMHRAQTMQP